MKFSPFKSLLLLTEAGYNLIEFCRRCNFDDILASGFGGKAKVNGVVYIFVRGDKLNAHFKVLCKTDIVYAGEASKSVDVHNFGGGDGGRSFRLDFGLLGNALSSGKEFIPEGVGQIGGVKIKVILKARLRTGVKVESLGDGEGSAH